MYEKTPRGFKIYGRFKDMYGARVRVQESSNVMGGIWIYTTTRENNLITPHLSVTDAKKLIEILESAIKDQEKVKS